MSKVLVLLSALTCLGLTPAIAAKGPQLTVDAINKAELGRQGGNANKAALIRAGVLLDRARFSPGVIDGSDGGNVRNAITAFQKQNGLQTSGRLDRDTWAKLTETSQDAALIEHTITDDDVKGPFVEKIPRKMEEQADLDRLGYRDATELLAEKFHMSEGLLKALNKGKNLSEAGTVIAVANVSVAGSQRNVKAGKIEVYKRERGLRVLDKDGKLIAAYPASIGSEEKPAPSGMTKITRVARNPTYTYNPKYEFKGVKTKEKFEIAAGPNNPVGLVWIALTGEGYGIHGTPEPDKVGKTASHGCVRLTNWDALDLLSLVETGLPVEFFD